MKTFMRTQYKVVNGELISFEQEFTEDELAELVKARNARLKAEKQPADKKGKKTSLQMGDGGDL